MANPDLIIDHYSIYVEKAIRVTPSQQSGIETFTVQSNSNYLIERGYQTACNKYRERYDSVELKTESNLSEYFKVLAMVSIINDKTDVNLGTLFLICKYKEVNSKSILPYTELMYAEGDPLVITTCDEQDISGPACIIPRREFLDNMYANPLGKNFVKDILRLIRMYCFNV